MLNPNPKVSITLGSPNSIVAIPEVSSPVSTQQYRAKIHVTLRPSVLDPAGVAVQSGLKQLGYEGVDSVRIGKYIELTAAGNARVTEIVRGVARRLEDDTAPP